MATESVTAVFYPEGNFGNTIQLTANETETIGFSRPVKNVLIDLVGNDPASERMVIGYALDDGPGRRWSHNTFTSGDGGAVIFPPKELDPDGVLILQTVTHLPNFPPDLRIIGRAYNVRTNKTATQFHDGSISFQYLGSDVLLSGYPESDLALHYWNGTAWVQLQTTLNSAQNIASAQLPGPGIYVLTVGSVKLNFNRPSPDSAEVGQPHELTITELTTNTYFMEPMKVMLLGETNQPYPLTVKSATSQTIVVETSADLPADLYGLKIEHPGSQSVISQSVFSLYTAKPDKSCFFDDFKSGLGKWSVGGEWGVVNRDNWEALTDSPNHPYLSAESGEILTRTMVSQSFDLSSCSSPTITISHTYQLADQDSIHLEISTDNGANWSLLLTRTGTEQIIAAETPDEEWKDVNWEPISVPVQGQNITTNTTTSQLRLTLVSNDFGSAKGWLVDSIAVGPSIPTALDGTEEPMRNNIVFLPLISRDIANQTHNDIIADSPPLEEQDKK